MLEKVLQEIIRNQPRFSPTMDARQFRFMEAGGARRLPFNGTWNTAAAENRLTTTQTGERSKAIPKIRSLTHSRPRHVGIDWRQPPIATGLSVARSGRTKEVNDGKRVEKSI
jgi:hypothetical protein